MCESDYEHVLMYMLHMSAINVCDGTGICTCEWFMYM